METATKLSPEVRERALRRVFEQGGRRTSRLAAIESIAARSGCSHRRGKFGSKPIIPFRVSLLIHAVDTYEWARQAEAVDSHDAMFDSRLTES